MGSVVPPAWQPTEPGLYVVPIDGSPVGPPIVPGSMQPGGVSFSPDGARLMFGSFTGNQQGLGDLTTLWVVNRDGSGLHRIAEDAHTAENAVWSPDGRMLAYNDDDPTTRTTDVYIADADGKNRRRLTTGGLGGTALRWSPQGDRLAFGGNRAYGGAYVVRVADGLVTRVLDSPVVNVSWSHDGSKLAARLEIFGAVVVSASGGSPQMINPEAASATWSPVADEIALLLRNVELFRHDGTPVRSLGVGYTPGAWSPNGRWLLGGGVQGLFAMPSIVDRCPLRLVAGPGPYSVGMGSWAPDSGSVAVVAT